MKTIDKQKNMRFRETFDSEISSERINEAEGKITGVKVIGFTSRNGREYLPETLQRGLSLYEGAKVYSDHKIGGRSIHERWGRLVNCQFVEGKGVVGDLEFLKTSPMTPHILEAIRRFGDSGLSHDAEGIVEMRNGKNVVTKLERVYSVDFVEDPATNNNLFESVQMKKKLLATLREGIDQKTVAMILANLAESKLVAEDAEFEPTSDAVQVQEAVGQALAVAVSGAATIEEGLKKVTALLGADAEELRATVKEQADKLTTLQTENTQLKEQASKSAEKSNCVTLLESMGREVTDVRVDALLALPQDKRGRLAESWPAKATRPAASPSKFSEGQKDGNKDSIPSDEEFFKAIMG